MEVRNDFKKIFKTEDMATSFVWILNIDGIFHKLSVDNTSQCLKTLLRYIYIYIYIHTYYILYVVREHE